MRFGRVLLASCLAGAIGCASNSDTAGGSALMVDTLASIYAQAKSEPRTNAFLNRERAEELSAVLASQSGGPALQTRYLLAQEQLLAGDTRKAIEGLETLRKDAALDLRSPNNKVFYDLLAIAYLRQGEQDNCLANPAANVCILPFDGPARHTQEDGARKAIALYEELLTRYPDDRGSQWLLNLAHMALGRYPTGVPRKWLIPGLNLRVSPTFPLFANVAGNVGLAINGVSGGLSVEDFNGDGLLDLFMTAFGITDPPHLFLADGKGAWTDATAEAGLTGIVGGLNNIHADYDNDGLEDILVLRGAWLNDAGRHPMSLLHNRGNGKFEDVTFAAGLGTLRPTHSAAWADFNLDGRLDLFVGHESAAARGGSSYPSELFLNNGNGTFTEVSSKFGLQLDAFVKGVVWGDVNNDGLPDLYASVLQERNRLFINKGGTSASNWRFEEAPDAGGASLPIMSFPVWFWDYDQDGSEDLLVLSYDIRESGALHQAVALEKLHRPLSVPTRNGPITVEPTRLFRNNGNGTFSDATKSAGLEDKVIFAMGTNFGDLDNDGWLDFYVGTGNPDLRSVIPNRMFRSVDDKGVRKFEEVTLEGGFGHIQKGHGAAFVDLDHDGDEDVFMIMGGAYQGDVAMSVLFENPGWAGRNWISLELEGTKANRSAIGARVEVLAANADGSTRRIYRTVGTGGSFGSGSLRLHVGLDRAVRVQEVLIRWPDADRSVSTYANLDVGKFYRIVQGQQPVTVSRQVVPFKGGSGAQAHEHR